MHCRADEVSGRHVALLEILNGAAAGQRYEIANGQTVLGVTLVCDVILPLRSISRPTRSASWPSVASSTLKICTVLTARSSTVSVYRLVAAEGSRPNRALRNADHILRNAARASRPVGRRDAVWRRSRGHRPQAGENRRALRQRGLPPCDPELRPLAPLPRRLENHNPLRLSSTKRSGAPRWW